MPKSPQSNADRAKLVEDLTIYLEDEMELAPTPFAVEGLLDFITEKVGKPHYQRGLLDAQKVFAEKVDEVNDRIFVLQSQRTR